MSDTYTMTPEKLRELLKKDAPSLYVRVKRSEVQQEEVVVAKKPETATNKEILNSGDASQYTGLSYDKNAAQDFQDFLDEEDKKKKLESDQSGRSDRSATESLINRV